MGESESKSWMREAFNATTQTLNSRIRRYKALIISIAVAVIGSVIWAIAWKSWAPLLGFILPISFCGIFFASDAILVGRWQRLILNLWIHDELDIGIFIDTISQVRMFPKNTLQSMLATLPSRELTVGISGEMKGSLSLTLRVINRCQIDRIVFSVLALTPCLLSLGLSLALLSWIPLIGLIFAFIALMIGKALRYIRFQSLAIIIKRQNMDIESFAQIAGKLDWGTAQKSKEKLLSAIVTVEK